MGHSKGSPKRKVYSYTHECILGQINNLILHLRLLEKQQQAKPKTSRRRKIIKIRAKINDTETKKKYKELMKQKR
jgi:hypothetical protein